MFSNVKKQIKELAKNAVLAAEAQLGSGHGQEKKKMAIDYVSILLSSFIDDVVELAVGYMKSLQNTTKGE